MFTGIIQTLAEVRETNENESGRTLTIVEPALAAKSNIGDSISINGVCLTVVARDDGAMRFQAVPETLAKTNLGELNAGDRVNLEPALRAGDPLGGHWVQGHIDGVGTIRSREKFGDGERMGFGCPPDIARQLVAKGSIAVDGISLTVVDPTSDGFSVALIPHTLAVTTLGGKTVGATVNLELDVLGKYVWKYMEQLHGT